MTRHRGHLIGLTAALTLALTACGGGDPSAKPTTSPSSSPTSSAPTSTAPSPTGPPAQPKGKYGVTVDILNWDKYAADAAVVAWKQTYEAVDGSVSRKKMVPGLVRRLGADARHVFTQTLQLAWDNDWHTKGHIPVRIRSRGGSGTKAVVTTCLWGPDYEFKQRDGNPAGDPLKGWLRVRWELRRVAGEWKIASLTQTGACHGGAPR